MVRRITAKMGTSLWRVNVGFPLIYCAKVQSPMVTHCSQPFIDELPVFLHADPGVHLSTQILASGERLVQCLLTTSSPPPPFPAHPKYCLPCLIPRRSRVTPHSQCTCCCTCCSCIRRDANCFLFCRLAVLRHKSCIKTCGSMLTHHLRSS